MDTLVTIEIVEPSSVADKAVERAFEWFQHVEQCCTRFDPQSELRRLCAQTSVPVVVGEVLFEAVRFALAVAEETQGAFDPTVGYTMQKFGFNREYRSGKIYASDPDCGAPETTYRDVVLDAERRTIKLLRPLVLDLGAVAKGLAIDMAARELQESPNFVIDAGGDLFVAGHNSKGKNWAVGIRHPSREGEFLKVLRASNTAICTSGCDTRGHHILDPRSSAPARNVVSATVLAPSAMMADALATAVFILDPHEGIRLLDRLGAEGLICTSAMDLHETRGLERNENFSNSEILQHSQRSSHHRSDDSDSPRSAG